VWALYGVCKLSLPRYIVCRYVMEFRYDMTETKFISIFEGNVYLHNCLAGIYLNTQETDKNVRNLNHQTYIYSWSPCARNSTAY